MYFPTHSPCSDDHDDNEDGNDDDHKQVYQFIALDRFISFLPCKVRRKTFPIAFDYRMDISTFLIFNMSCNIFFPFFIFFYVH